MKLNTIFANIKQTFTKIAIDKLQKKYQHRYNVEIPMVLVAKSALQDIEILLIKKFYEVNNWKVIDTTITNKQKLLFQRDIPKSTLLVVQGNANLLRDKTPVARGLDFSLVIKDKYILNKQYLWPKSIAKIIYTLDNLQVKHKFEKQGLAEFVEKIELPQHIFGRKKSIMDTTLIDNTLDTDQFMLCDHLDTFEEVVKVYSTADFDSPEYQNSIVVAPKHTIIQGQIDCLKGDILVLEHKKVLQRLYKFCKDYEHYLDEIYLIGNNWLKCDEQGITKRDGLTHYIRYSGHTFKVVQNIEDLNLFVDTENIRPHSWFWLNGSKELDWSDFCLTK